MNRRIVGSAAGRTLVLAAVYGVSVGAGGGGGCTVGPDHTPPRDPAPDAPWPEPMEAGLSTAEADLRDWWRSLGDPGLDSLVERALAGNLDLREAVARVREARARRGVVAADLWPTVNVGGSGTYERYSENTFGGFGNPGDKGEFYEVGFDATWELDVFGGIRRAVEAAEADTDAAIESVNDVRVTLISEVARNYTEFRSFQARLAIAHENLRIQEETLEVSESRFQAGVSGQLEVAQQRSQLESTRAQIPVLEIAMKEAAYRLDVLLGLRPGSLMAELAAPAPVPAVPESVPVGLPAELLRRRPDIRRAERDLAAATARIGVATADLYPRFRLNGSFGLESTHFSDLFESGSRAWSVGPFEVIWPIFDAGRIRNNIRVQEARQEQALAAYERTVLLAHEEVARALVGYARLRERRDSLRRAVEANRQAVELANELWLRGLSDFLNVLQTQRDLFVLEDELAASEAAVTTNLIALYKALGGGWDVPSPPPPTDDDPAAATGVARAAAR